MSHEAVIDTFRQKVLARSGGGGFRSLSMFLRTLDQGGNADKKLNKDELADALDMFKMGHSRHEVQVIFEYFDKDKSGSITITEFMVGLRPEMPTCRKELVMQAHALLDANSDGSVTMEDIKRLFDATKHPDVLTGKKTSDQVFTEFCSEWDKNGDNVITKDEFVEYYNDISAGIDSDQYFELMMRNAWHISGGEGAAANTSCRRVLVSHNDGTQSVHEIKNDLGIGAKDVEKMRAKLEAQGVKDIKTIELTM